MVQHIVGVLLAAVELLEAEAARLKVNARQLVMNGAVAVIVAIAAGGALATGTVFLSWAFYAALRPSMGDALAAMTVGLTVWIVAGGAAWLAIGRLRR